MAANSMEAVLAAAAAVLDDNDDVEFLMQRMKRRRLDDDIVLRAAVSKGMKMARGHHFLEHCIPQFSDTAFYSHFRMSRETMEIVIKAVGPLLTANHLGRPTMAVRDIVLIGLWTLASEEGFRQISDRFGVAISTAHDTFYDFVQALNKIMKEYIKWPTKARMEEIAAAFEKRNGFTGVIGLIDGFQIPLKKQPKIEGSKLYLNQKKFYSINLMAVVDDAMSFTDIHVGWPGSVCDGRVHQSSPLSSLLENGGIPQHLHILGDTAFPLSNSLMVPYRDNGGLSRAQHNFNKLLASLNRTVYRAFGLLKGKFRKLKYALYVRTPEKASEIASAACVLHNICISQKDWDEDEIEMEDDDDSVDYFEDHDISPTYAITNTNGIAKRDVLAEYLL